MSDTPLEAVVVGAVDVGEASRVVRLLTPDRGRVAVIARGARSSRRRFAGLLDPGTHVRLGLVRGRGELAVWGHADRLGGPSRARNELERLALLAYGCELCAALAPEEHEAPKLFRLLVTWLALLEGEARPGRASRWGLEAKALTFAGFTPHLLRCALCGEPIDDPAVFDAGAGGALHRRCGGGASVDLTELAFLERLRRTPLAETPSLPGDLGAPFRLSDFARYQLGHDLKSRGMVTDLHL